MHHRCLAQAAALALLLPACAFAYINAGFRDPWEAKRYETDPVFRAEWDAKQRKHDNVFEWDRAYSDPEVRRRSDALKAGFASPEAYERHLREKEVARQAENLNRIQRILSRVAPYSLAIARHPDDATRFLQRGVAWHYSQPDTRAIDYDGKELDPGKHALDDYNEALRLDPKLGRAYLRRGLLLERMSDLEKAAEVAPEDALIHGYLAYSCLKGGILLQSGLIDRDRALHHAQKACRLSERRDARYLRLLAFVHAVRREPDKAAEVQAEADSILEIKANRAVPRADPQFSFAPGDLESVARK